MELQARVVFLALLIIVTTISSWIVGARLRRRIRKALGGKVSSELELTSLNTWMRVREAERNEAESNGE
jgi:hypothetical protein